jgi:nucleotide-binding universal stress UspA family protein
MFKTVLVAVDVVHTGQAQKTLSAVKDLVAPWHCTTHVASIVPNFGMAIVGSYFDKGFQAAAHDKTEEELRAAVAAAGLDAECHVVMGTVYDRIIALANTLDADLIVISAHSPDLEDYLLGSNAARVVRHSQRSVLVLRD